MDRTLSGATSPCQSGPASDGNEGVLCIPQSSNITGTSPSDCLVSYSEHSLGEFYLSAEMQSVHSTAPTDWAWIVWDTTDAYHVWLSDFLPLVLIHYIMKMFLLVIKIKLYVILLIKGIFIS